MLSNNDVLSVFCFVGECWSCQLCTCVVVLNVIKSYLIVQFHTCITFGSLSFKGVFNSFKYRSRWKPSISRSLSLPHLLCTDDHSLPSSTSECYMPTNFCLVCPRTIWYWKRSMLWTTCNGWLLLELLIVPTNKYITF